MNSHLYQDQLMQGKTISNLIRPGTEAADMSTQLLRQRAKLNLKKYEQIII
jgi:hypothetical protein